MYNINRSAAALFLLIFLRSINYSRPKIKMEANFYDPKNFSGARIVYKLAKNHLISRKKISLTIDPFIDHYMAMDNDTSYELVKRMPSYRKRATTFNGSYVVQHDIFISYDCGVVFNNKFYSYEYEKWARTNQPGEIIDYVGEIIYLGHIEGHNNFGHMMQDIFHPLTLIPESVFKRAKMLMNLLPVGVEIVELLGLKKDQEVFIKKNQWVHATIAHTITYPSSYLSTYSSTALKVVEILRKKLKISDIKGDKYYFSNRCLNCSRHISNLPEIMQATQLRYPDIEFRVLNEFVKSLNDVTKTWATIKFLFAPTGSNIVKGYFMHAESVMVTIVGWKELEGDPSVLINNALARIYILQYIVPHLLHFKKVSFAPDMNKTLECIDAGIYCARNHRWPKTIFTLENNSTKFV